MNLAIVPSHQRATLPNTWPNREGEALLLMMKNPVHPVSHTCFQFPKALPYLWERVPSKRQQTSRQVGKGCAMSN